MSNSSVMKPRLIGSGSVVSRLPILLALLMVLLPSCLLAQEEGTEHLGVPTDWSHRHMVFSPPGSPMEAFNLSGNPRYVQQWLRRNVERRHRRHGNLHADWSQSMGAGATVGAGQYPAKYSYDATVDDCTKDFVVFNTGLAGAPGQASIIAYNNLYFGCTGTVPSVYWAYDTSGTISTSVTLSLDGTQLAFVQTQGGKATLVLLKWKASATDSATTPTVLSTLITNINYRGCPAPCMTTLTFTGNPKDTYSSPYYDFTPLSDTLYVGDDAGSLHQFTGLFAPLATPAESAAPWPVHVAVVPLSGPVFDSTTGNVFVTTSWQQSSDSGGRLAAVCAKSPCDGKNNGFVTTAIGTITPSNVLGPTAAGSPPACHPPGTSGDGVGTTMRLDAPLVDSVAGRVYAFLGNDGNGNSAVIQFSTTVISTQFFFHSCGIMESTIGTGSTTGAEIPVFAGSFDNLYFTSDGGGSPSGNLYVCGNTSGNATLYQVRITSNAMAASGTLVLTVSTGNPTCSPVTEVFSSSTDWIFLSVDSLSSTSSPVNCPSNLVGCLMSFSVPTTLGGTLPAGTTATLAASGGTSGVVIDNTVASGTLATSQIYFSTLTGGTAVQASQALLK